MAPYLIITMAQHSKTKKCCICGRVVFSDRSKYCLTCSIFAARLINEHFPPKTIKKIWKYIRKYGYVCYYTGMELDMTNPRSPWYCVFDHWRPQDSSKIVITSSLLNTMKSDLTEKEFWFMIRQLASFKRMHIELKKIELRYWDRDYTPDDELLGNIKTGQKTCCICGEPVYLYNAKYCLRCSLFSRRIIKRQLPPETVKAIWDYIRQYGYVCYYTGMPLELNNDRSPWYCVFDHWIPGDQGKVVLTFALFNEMKSDLSEKEFWYFVCQLADFKEKNKKVRKMKLIYWERLYEQRIARLELASKGMIS